MTSFRLPLDRSGIQLNRFSNHILYEAHDFELQVALRTRVEVGLELKEMNFLLGSLCNSQYERFVVSPIELYFHLSKPSS